MISKKLQSRLKFIEATPLRDRAQTSVMSRRDSNYVVMDEEDSELDKYDTFFEYEEELADLKASGEQFKEIFNEDPFIVLEEKDEAMHQSVEPVVMEDFSALEMTEIETSQELSVDFKENKSYTDVVGFDFIQCEFVKKDGDQCKRQAPKGHSICSTHKKYIAKHLG